MHYEKEIMFWEHYCTFCDDIVEFPVGFMCDWCQKTEDDFKREDMESD